MKAILKFLLKGFTAVAVPAAFGLLLSSLVLMNTALFGLANGALARMGLDTASSALERQVRAEAVQDRRAKRKAAGEIRKKAISKATSSAKRNIAAMPLEAVPVLGVATVFTVTAWEVADLCELMIYIDALTRLHDPETAADETTELCKSFREEVDNQISEIKKAKDKADSTLAKIKSAFEKEFKVFKKYYGLESGQ